MFRIYLPHFKFSIVHANWSRSLSWDSQGSSNSFRIERSRTLDFHESRWFIGVLMSHDLLVARPEGINHISSFQEPRGERPLEVVEDGISSVDVPRPWDRPLNWRHHDKSWRDPPCRRTTGENTTNRRWDLRDTMMDGRPPHREIIC